MTENRVVRFYLHKKLKQRAEAGDHNFIHKFSAVLREQGFKVRFHDNSLIEEVKSETRPGHSVFLMTEPTTDRGVTIRLNYFYPFWKIEKTSKRWDWPVSIARFDAESVAPDLAQNFTNYWRRKHFDTKANRASQEGFAYVPLQGRLLSHRSFQFCSPIEMLEYLLEYDKSRNFVATLHPKEEYSSQEVSALLKLEKRHPRLTVSNQDMVSLLQGCDYVATQNSAAALSGFFFRKPAILFGKIDFHHIAANVHDLGVEEAINRVMNLRPDYDAYLTWFLQNMSINAGRPEAEEKILEAIRVAGWVE